MTTEMITTIVKALIVIAAAILKIAGEWKILEKMGEKGWKALVPFYSEYLIFKHIWSTNAFWATLATATVFGVAKELSEHAAKFTPAMGVALVTGIACIVLVIKTSHKLAKAFGHGIGYTLGLIFAEPIFIPVIGFGKSRFVEG